MAPTISALLSPRVDTPIRRICFNGDITYRSITPDNIEALKAVNWELFAIAYPDAYYVTTMRAELTEFCKLSAYSSFWSCSMLTYYPFILTN
jgi:hypothetical protein